MAIYLGNTLLTAGGSGSGSSGGGVPNSYAAFNLPPSQPMYTDPDGGVWLRTGTVLTEDGSGTATDAASYPNAIGILAPTETISSNSISGTGSFVTCWRHSVTVVDNGVTTTYPDGIIWKKGNGGDRIFMFNAATGAQIGNTYVGIRVEIGSTNNFYDAFPMSTSDPDNQWFYIFGQGNTLANTTSDGQYVRLDGDITITGADNLEFMSAEEITAGMFATGIPSGAIRTPDGTFWALWYSSSNHRFYQTNGAGTIDAVSPSNSIVAADWDGTYLITVENDGTDNDGAVRLIRRRESDGEPVDSNGDLSSELADVTIEQLTNVSDVRSQLYGNRLALTRDSANGALQGYVAMDHNTDSLQDANIFNAAIGNGTALYAPTETISGTDVSPGGAIYVKLN